VTPIAGAGEKPLAVDSNHIAIKGYDTVAYFTDGKAIKGSSQFEYVYGDATWRFSNAAHREMFIADPDRYMPQYGAYCAACVATKACAAAFPNHPADPEAWTIVDGRLYMVGDKEGLGRWRANSAENIRQANARWTAIQQRYAPQQQ
jgi:YHS domain-containing protein